MKSALIATALLLLCSITPAFSAGPDLKQPIAVLTLSDGRVLRGAEIKAFNSKGVMIRHDGGVAQVNYELLPTPYQEAALAKKPTPVTATTPQPSQVAPPRNPRNDVRRVAAKELQGAVYLRVGRSPKPVPDFEIAVYPLAYLVQFDQARRQALPAAHLEFKQRLVGGSPAGSPNPEQITQFNQTEYASWDGLETAPFSTRTNEKGEFALMIPRDGKFAVFARRLEVSGDNQRCFIWAVEVDGEGVILNSTNLYPLLK